MEAIKVYKYEETPITFNIGKQGGTMINATQMAKPFGKRPVDYLRLPSTNELISAIVRKSHISENQLVTSKQGSAENGGGTWMHEDIALDFAQWLSVDFKLWCNDRIKEILRYGYTTIHHGQKSITEYCAPETVMIGEKAVWTINKDGKRYYRFRDILNAIGIYRKDKRATYRERPYICWINDGTGNTLKRYVTEKGAQAFFEGIRKKDGRMEEFRNNFFKFICRENDGSLPKRLAEKPLSDTDRERLMDIIINIREEEDRKFLYGVLRDLTNQQTS